MTRKHPLNRTMGEDAATVPRLQEPLHRSRSIRSLRAAHLNCFELGQHGRHRSNLWGYAGGSSFHAGHTEELAMHPTCKPVAPLADAIRDVSHRGAIVFDPFAGSCSTLFAAEKTGRRAYVLEVDPVYCDVIIRRFEAYTGKTAQLDGEGLTFEEAENTRVAGSTSLEGLDQQRQPE